MTNSLYQPIPCHSSSSSSSFLCGSCPTQSVNINTKSMTSRDDTHPYSHQNSSPSPIMSTDTVSYALGNSGHIFPKLIAPRNVMILITMVMNNESTTLNVDSYSLTLSNFATSSLKWFNLNKKTFILSSSNVKNALNIEQKHESQSLFKSDEEQQPTLASSKTMYIKLQKRSLKSGCHTSQIRMGMVLLIIILLHGMKLSNLSKLVLSPLILSLTDGANLNLSDWNISQYQLPRVDYMQVIGYNEINNSIIIIGGWNYDHQLVKYSLDPFRMRNEGPFVLDKGIYVVSQSYVQHGNMLYFDSGDLSFRYTLYSMDLSSTVQSSTIALSYTTIPVWACMTSMTLKYDYLFVIGGFDGTNYRNDMNIFNITSKSWTYTQSRPYLNTARDSHLCTSMDQKMYAIGGHDGTNYSSSIEILDVSIGVPGISFYNNSWQYFSESLPVGLGYHRSINYASNIIIIGGWLGGSDYNDNIYIINTITGDIYTAGSLSYTAWLAPAILVWPVIYIFGGFDGSLYRKTYQYHSLKFSIYSYC